MKGNQEPMLYTTNAAVASLNHVPGFDPLKFLRRTTSRKTGEDVMRLDLRYKKLWFRLACPRAAEAQRPAHYRENGNF